MQNKKISRAFIWLCILIVTFGAFNTVNVKHINENSVSVYRNTGLYFGTLTEIKYEIQNLRVYARNIALIAGDPKDHDFPTYDNRQLTSTSFNRIDSLLQRFRDSNEKDPKRADIYFIDMIQSIFDDKVRRGFIEMMDEAKNRSADTDSVWELYGPVGDSMATVDNLLDELLDAKSQAINDKANRTDIISHWSITGMLIMIVIEIGFLFGIQTVVTSELVDPIKILLKYARILNGKDDKILSTDIDVISERYNDHRDPISDLIFHSIIYWHKIGVLHDTLEDLDLPPQRMPVIAAKDVSTVLDDMLNDSIEISNRAKAVLDEIQWLSNSTYQHTIDVQNAFLMVCGIKDPSEDSRTLFSINGDIAFPSEILRSTKHMIYDQEKAEKTDRPFDDIPVEEIIEMVSDPSDVHPVEQDALIKRDFLVDNETGEEYPLEGSFRHYPKPSGDDPIGLEGFGASILASIIKGPQQPNWNHESEDQKDLDDDEDAMPNSVINEKRRVQLVVLYDSKTYKAELVGQLPTGEIIRDGIDIPSFAKDLSVSLREHIAKDSVGNTYPLIIQ